MYSPPGKILAVEPALFGNSMPVSMAAPEKKVIDSVGLNLHI